MHLARFLRAATAALVRAARKRSPIFQAIPARKTQQARNRSAPCLILKEINCEVAQA